MLLVYRSSLECHGLVKDLTNLVFSGHPWIVDDSVAPDKPLDPAVLTRLKHFSTMNKLKKMAIRVCLIVMPYLFFV